MLGPRDRLRLFAMPDASRLREVSLEGKFCFEAHELMWSVLSGAVGFKYPVVRFVCEDFEFWDRLRS